MEWQGVICGVGGEPLGTLAEVAAQLEALFPGLSFEWSPTGVEQLAVLDARKAVLPDFFRRIVAARPSRFSASLEVGAVSVSFNLGSKEPVERVWTTVGGEDEPALAAFKRLEQHAGWVLLSPEPLTVETIGPDQTPKITGGATLFLDASKLEYADPEGEPGI